MNKGGYIPTKRSKNVKATARQITIAITTFMKFIPKNSLVHALHGFFIREVIRINFKIKLYSHSHSCQLTDHMHETGSHFHKPHPTKELLLNLGQCIFVN